MVKGIKNKKNVKRPIASAIAKRRPVDRSKDTAIAGYLGQLSDPCNSNMVHAPYSGAGSAYLMRTVDQIQPFAGLTETSVGDFVYEITPWNTPSLATGCMAATGGSATIATVTSSNFITTASVVKAYRPIAACVKWVPTGAIAARSGAIGMSYSNSKTMPAIGGVISPGSLLRSCQEIATNGTVAHEAVWLPSFADQRMGNNSDANTSGAGSLLVVGLGVDTKSNGVNSMASGYLEVTVVWEWEPYIYGSGAVASLAPTPGYTLEMALSKIKDVGKFVFQHVRMAQQLYANAAGGRYLRGPTLLDY